jgi:copper chaperone
MIKLNVPDMSCNHCVGAITGAIKAVDPQADVKTDLAAKTVTVETTHSLANIAKAVDGAGFPNTAA